MLNTAVCLGRAVRVGSNVACSCSVPCNPSSGTRTGGVHAFNPTWDVHNAEVFIDLDGSILLQRDTTILEIGRFWCYTDAHDDEVCRDGLPVDDNTTSCTGFIRSRNNLFDLGLHVEDHALGLVVLRSKLSENVFNMEDTGSNLFESCTNLLA